MATVKKINCFDCSVLEIVVRKLVTCFGISFR